jgi:SHS2 domain-containing protein
MREFFEHTADLGLRIRAANLDALFAEAGECLFTAIVEDLATVRLEAVQTIEIAGTEREYLLFDWLRELLYRFDADHMVYSHFEVRVRDDGLTATVRGERLDPARHVLSHEVKAITYHDLRVERTADGWLAEVIVDI